MQCGFKTATKQHNTVKLTHGTFHFIAILQFEHNGINTKIRRKKFRTITGLLTLLHHSQHKSVKIMDNSNNSRNNDWKAVKSTLRSTDCKPRMHAAMMPTVPQNTMKFLCERKLENKYVKVKSNINRISPPVVLNAAGYKSVMTSILYVTPTLNTS